METTRCLLNSMSTMASIVVFSLYFDFLFLFIWIELTSNSLYLDIISENIIEIKFVFAFVGLLGISATN